VSNLTVDGDSDYSSTGTPDTYTPVSDGPSGTDAVAAHINGVATAITELQTLIGNALTLKGSTADLVARLSKVIHSDGAFAKGTSFPGTPIDGQPFYRTDLNALYVYDAGTTSWTQGLDTGEFALIDGTREFTGDVKIEKATPGVRLRGTEASADDVLIREDTGVLYIYRNTGSEGSPTWTLSASLDLANGHLTIIGNLKTKSGTSYLGTFDHANTADRVYTLPNADWDFMVGTVFKGPTSCGSGSTRTHEGSLTVSGNGNYSGIHFYTDFTLNSSVTMTVPAGTGRLVIVATGTITINGTISASGAALSGSCSGNSNAPGNAGYQGTSQAGGGGGGSSDGNAGGAGGAVVVHGLTVQAGGTAGVGTGGNATAISGSSCRDILAYLDSWGGASGGSGGGCAGPVTGATGGAGGGVIVLIAPTVVLAATATLNASGANGSGGGAAGGGGPWAGSGGGGGGGAVIIVTRSFTDNGATFTVSGGTGASSSGGGAGAGGNGAAGIKQILIHA